VRIKVLYLSVCDLAVVVGSVVGLCAIRGALCCDVCSGCDDELVGRTLGAEAGVCSL